MAVNKNFVVKNGLEVDTDLIFADASTNKVGIGIGYVNIKHSLGDEIYLLIRDKLVKAEITKLPLKNG